MKADSAIFEAFEEHSPLDPAVAERNLMRAMLKLALDDMRKGGKLGDEARKFFQNKDQEYLFSFQSICRELDYCAETVRKISGMFETPPEEESEQPTE